MGEIMAGQNGRKLVLACLALLVINANGCTHSMDMNRCRELFAEFPVDAAAARQIVPAGYTPRIHAQGTATLLVMVQDCEEGILDGLIHIRPMRMSQIWLEVEGPAEIGPPLDGTAESLPTAYYYILPHQVESGLAHAALALAGIDSQPVKEITLGERQGNRRMGRVVEEPPNPAYQWVETGEPWTAPRIVTGRRKFYRQYGTWVKRSSEGSVACRSAFLGEGSVVFTASQDSAIGLLMFGTRLEGTSNPVEMNCRAEITVRLQ